MKKNIILALLFTGTLFSYSFCMKSAEMDEITRAASTTVPPTLKFAQRFDSIFRKSNLLLKSNIPEIETKKSQIEKLLKEADAQPNKFFRNPLKTTNLLIKITTLARSIPTTHKQFLACSEFSCEFEEELEPNTSIVKELNQLVTTLHTIFNDVALRGFDALHL